MVRAAADIDSLSLIIKRTQEGETDSGGNGGLKDTEIEPR